MKTYNTSDIAEEAHALTVKECKASGIIVDCTNCDECKEAQEDGDEIETHYTVMASKIFDYHFDAIEARYEADKNYKREE